MAMTSKERVRAALERKPADRIPIFMWFHPETAARLSRMLEIPPTAVGEAMGNDVRQTWVNNNYAMEGITHDREGERHTDFWGITWEKVGPFNQIARFPLAEASPEEVLAYAFPTDTRVEWSYDEATGKLTYRRVLKAFQGREDHYCILNGEIRVTAFHRFLTEQGWMRAFAESLEDGWPRDMLRAALDAHRLERRHGLAGVDPLEQFPRQRFKVMHGLFPPRGSAGTGPEGPAPARLDQKRWPPYLAASAAFALLAMAPKASRSCTARSASALRSISIPAFFRPFIRRL